MDAIRGQKRPRALQACDICRVRKHRCDEGLPCSYCAERNLACTYPQSPSAKRHRPEQLQTSRQPIEPFTPFGSAAVRAVAAPCPAVQSSQSPPLEQRTGLDSRQPAVSSHSARQSGHKAPGPVNDIQYFGSTSMVDFVHHTRGLLEAREAHQPDGVSVSMRSAPLQKSRDLMALSSVKDKDRFYEEEALPFVGAYFENLHAWEPLLDEDDFHDSCEDIWEGDGSNVSRSFLALYYAVLGVGSLFMVNNSTRQREKDHTKWSRVMHREALGVLGNLGTATNILLVQCLHLLARMCQYDMNPRGAYLYSGRATRMALAIGLNKMTTRILNGNSGALLTASKTWWAVYCLDIEMSSALGRPDSLGLDQFHTQRLPTEIRITSDATDLLQIVPVMVDLARIRQQVAVDLYARSHTTAQLLLHQKALHDNAFSWWQALPQHLSWVSRHEPNRGRRGRRAPHWKELAIQKQALVLELAYRDIMMLIHVTPIRSSYTEATADEAALLTGSYNFCVMEARKALQAIDSTLRSEHYFRSRYYTAAHTTISAASVLLGVLFNQRFAISCVEEDQADAVDGIELACEILGSMDDCPIAVMAGEAIAGALTRYREWTETEGGPPRRRHEHQIGAFRSKVQEDMSAEGDPERDYWMQWITEIEKLGTVY